MFKIAFTVLLLPALLSMASACSAHSSQARVDLKDCYIAFNVPDNLEYVEVDNSTQPDNSLCDLAFNPKGRQQPDAAPGMTEGWREMVGVTLAIKPIPLDVTLKKIEAESKENNQPNIFELTSKKEILLHGGTLYVYTYSIQHPTAAMLRLKQNGKTTFVAGDNSHSTSYTIYSTSNEMAQKITTNTIFQLLSSFEFKAYTP